MRIENITTSVDNEFYPTPEHFAKEILKNVDCSNCWECREKYWLEEVEE